MKSPIALALAPAAIATAIAILAVAALASGACGGDDGDTTDLPAAVTGAAGPDEALATGSTGSSDDDQPTPDGGTSSDGEAPTEPTATTVADENSDNGEGENGGASFESTSLTIVKADGAEVALAAELAVSREQKSQGLSGREEVPLETGMLFILGRSSGFWMKDTLVPLSIAFIADCGEIVDIQDMEPLTRDIHRADEDYIFALETAQGWFDSKGVVPGDVVGMPEEHLPPHC